MSSFIFRADMSSIPKMQSWVYFFEVLRELPELWMVKSAIYKDRTKKIKAWNKLLQLYKKIDPTANIDTLKKRVTNIKSCYHRELKKVERSQRTGNCPDDEYVPTLWYFNLLHFLRDQETQIPGLSIVNFVESEFEMDPQSIIVSKFSTSLYMKLFIYIFYGIHIIYAW